MRYGWMPEGLISGNKYLIAKDTMFLCRFTVENILIYSEVFQTQLQAAQSNLSLKCRPLSMV